MDYQKNWDQVKKRLTAVWENEIVDRCCIAVSAKIDPSKPWGLGIKRGDSPQELYDKYMDAENIRKNWEAQFDNTYFAGDSFPVIWSNFGPSGHAKYFKGASYQYQRDSVWYQPSITAEELDPADVEFDPDSEILKKELEVVRYLAREAKDRYFVSMPDNCGCIDALAYLRDSSQLIYDIMDYPEQVSACIEKVVDGLHQSNPLFFDAIRENNQGGSVHGWMNSWYPGTHQQLQVDFSVMISPEIYEEFALPELQKTSSALDRAIYHLDGQEQIRHLDYILSVPNIRRIQWTPVEGQPLTSCHLPALKRIQAAGKGLVLFPEPHEVETLLTELSSKGLQLIVKHVNGKDDADALVRMAERLTHE